MNFFFISNPVESTTLHTSVGVFINKTERRRSKFILRKSFYSCAAIKALRAIRRICSTVRVAHGARRGAKKQEKKIMQRRSTARKSCQWRIFRADKKKKKSATRFWRKRTRCDSRTFPSPAYIFCFKKLELILSNRPDHCY